MHSIEAWRAFVDELPDAVALLSDTRVAHLNPPAFKLFGVGVGAQPAIERLFPVAEERRRLVANRTGGPLELECCRPNGTRFLVDVRTRVVEGSDPPLRICAMRVTDEIWASRRHRTLNGQTPEDELTRGANADQTARKEAERERERIVAVLEETPDFVVIAAPDHSLLYLNRSARSLLGVADEEDLSRLALGDHHTAASREVLQRTVLPAAERDGVWSGDATLVASDGREVPVSLVALAHFRGDDSIERYSMVARDLSRERELEEQLFQSQKMEALGRMAGGAAHDFNNLLCVIMGGTDLALMRLADESPVRGLLEDVLDASKRATELTQQMLTFSRKSASRPHVVVNVNDVIERMKHIVLRLLGRDIELRMRLAPDLGNIRADPTQVEQVILNLVVNARDAMPEGGKLTVQTQPAFIGETDAHASVKAGAHVVLRVSDTGTGMDSETKTRIFEPFFTTKRVGKGTGLGLATVFGIVKASGGSIRVDSELGRGTSFDISFPCSRGPATASHAPAPC
jgi:PAS domain S-box-containing protein